MRPHAFVVLALAAATLAAQTPTQLPVTRVALYKNGVGYFEHSGHVTGSQAVTIDFSTTQLNDVLQSLTAIDLNGGRISGAAYNSTTPLAQQLASLPIGLGANAAPVAFYNSIRGARIEVRSGASTIAGRLMNIEVVNTPATSTVPAQQKRILTLVSDAGEVSTRELTLSTSVRLLDADLHQDLNRYLQLIANTRNQGLRHLTLQDNGTGIRSLLVSYISEVPIWKSTYRILLTSPKPNALTAPQTATLQGWSVIDNTTGADWVNVQLSLIAGAPQSFIQPLSIPYYSRRPLIGLPQEAQLTPQLHESGDAPMAFHSAALSIGLGGIQGTLTDRSGAVIRNGQITATNTDTGVQASRTTNASGDFAIRPLAAGRYDVEAIAPGFQRLLQQNVTLAATQTVGLNLKLSVGAASQTVTVTTAPQPLDTMDASLGGSIGNQMYSQLPLSMGGNPRNPAAFASLMHGASSLHGNAYGGSGSGNLNENYVEGVPVGSQAAAYVDAVDQFAVGTATTAAFDDYFAYNLTEAITIRKNESAMVPILQAKIDAERITLWSPRQPVPLRALWITNTSNLTLDRGSFSIVEDGNFGGEGRLDPIHPAEKRLLSYAVDQAVHVTTEPPASTSRVVSISAAKGLLVLHNTEVAEVSYTVRNAASQPRTILVEHPIHQGYTLQETGSETPKPAETTSAVYRFRVVAAPGETAHLRVVESHPGETTYDIGDTSDAQLLYVLEQIKHSAVVEAALQAIFAARRHQADMQAALDNVNAHLAGLRSDEDRQRANVTALNGADKTARERFVHDLNATEDQIAATQKELTAAEAALQAAKDDLAAKIESIQLDERL
jgi:hypothetical protein